MKRSIAAAAIALIAAASALAQTAIDKPAATLKLTKQELISVRQLKADADRIEAVTGQKLTIERRKELLDSKINGMLFSQYCERERILAPEAEVTAAIAQLKSQLGPGADDAKLDAALKSQGILLDAKTYVRQQILLRNYLQQKRAADLKAVKEPTSEEVLKAYELYKSKLVRPDTVRVSVLFVDLRPLGPEDKRKAVEAMRQVAGIVKAGPQKFDEQMLKASDQGSLVKATTTLYVEKSPEFLNLYGSQFMDAVFKLRAGEVSELLENEAGLQVVRAAEILPQKQLGLSDPLPGNPQATVQDYLKYNLAMERQNEVLSRIQAELVAQLRKESTVKIYDENLNF
ncbi:MAG: peptidyl-prolyl cis-trans isomerase [Spirochaetaceae bacterium]|nr:peptidyl-prolyl cis-trans isomerase [Spirochaetaceae bacterium]